MTEPEFVTFLEAARLVGVTDRTLRRRVRAGDLTAFLNPLDRRERLVRLADLRTYATPQPLVPNGKGPSTAQAAPALAGSGAIHGKRDDRVA